MSITPLSSASLAESSLFTSLANNDSSSSTATNLIDAFLAPSDSTASDSIFPDFPTEATLTAALSASLGANPTAEAASTSSTDPNSLSSIAQDFTSLLKNLSSGDVSGSQSAVAKLQADLNAGGTGSTSSTSSTSTSSTANPLQKLLTSISSSLTSGDTTTALQSLTSFLIQGGSSSSGTLINATA